MRRSDRGEIAKFRRDSHDGYLGDFFKKVAEKPRVCAF